MAEHAKHPESHERAITPEAPAEVLRHHEHEKHHETPEHEKLAHKHELEHRAKQEAKGRHEIQIDEKDKKPAEPVRMGRDIKTQAYQQTLKKVRGHLSPFERSFSKVIHQPVVDAVSEAGGKTLARPSGLLGGGITALVGSGVILYMGKHYGFRYSFFVYILCFVVGFGLGIVLELLIKTARSKS